MKNTDTQTSGIENQVVPGDRILVEEREATVMGIWGGHVYFALDEEEPRTRRAPENVFLANALHGGIEAL